MAKMTWGDFKKLVKSTNPSIRNDTPISFIDVGRLQTLTKTAQIRVRMYEDDVGMEITDKPR